MDRALKLGFAPAFDAVARLYLSHCDRLFVRAGGSDLARYLGLCRVHDASGSGHVRLGGVAVAWSDDPTWLVAPCLLLPDPVLVVFYDGQDSEELRMTIEERAGALIVRADAGSYCDVWAFDGQVAQTWQLAPEFAVRLAEPTPIAGRARRVRGR